VQTIRRCYVQKRHRKPRPQKAGAEVSHIDDRKFREVAIPKGEAIKSWPLYRDILEADKIIMCPIAKHHSLSGLTLSF